MILGSEKIKLIVTIGEEHCEQNSFLLGFDPSFNNIHPQPHPPRLDKRIKIHQVRNSHGLQSCRVKQVQNGLKNEHY